MFECNGPANPFPNITLESHETCFGEYVPPCERHPFYEDFRDISPSITDVFINLHREIYNPWWKQPAEQVKNIELVECSRCGAFFRSETSGSHIEWLCDDCLSKLYS